MTFAELDEFERGILKNPNYAGHIIQWMQAGKYTPNLRLGHMTTVENTIIACTCCHGERDIAVNHHNGHITWEVCPNCRGTGVMSNKVLPAGDTYKPGV